MSMLMWVVVDMGGGIYGEDTLVLMIPMRMRMPMIMGMPIPRMLYGRIYELRGMDDRWIFMVRIVMPVLCCMDV